MKSFNIIVKDKNGKTMITMLRYIDKEIKSEETRTIISNSDISLSKVDSIEYTINK